MLSDTFQQVIPTGNWMYPVTQQALPAGFEQLTLPAKALEFTADEIATQRRSWIREWQHALTQ